MATAEKASANERDEASSRRGESPEPEMEFESYFDRDSGSWSLRKIPSSPPASAPAEPASGDGDGDGT